MRFPTPFVVITSLVAAVFLCGCGNSESDYKPSPTSAHDALTTGLTAWTEGKPAGELPAAAKGQPAIHFADYQWTAGKRLAKFQVLDESPTLEGSTHMFRVQLELAGEPPQQAEYYIVGIDPLWVMRDRDYRQTSMQ
jgi:hypothetical protein